MEELQKLVEEKGQSSGLGEFERAHADAKVEASKKEVNVDALFQRLVLLEGVARKIDHKDKAKYTMMLSRFHVHKEKPSFVAALVLKVLCTKEEEIILEKEQKLLKSFSSDVKLGNHPDTTVRQPAPTLPNPVWPMGMWQYPSPFMPPSYGGPMPRFEHGQSYRPRARGTGSIVCYRCKKQGHIVRDCPEAEK